MVKHYIRNTRILITEKKTGEELSNFGLVGGSYASQSGHDDIAMTVVIVGLYFESDNFYQHVDEIYDKIDKKYKTAIEEKMSKPGQAEDEEIKSDIDFLRNLME